MSGTEDDPIASMRARRKRTAIGVAGVLVVGIAAFVWMLGGVASDMADPAQPLGRFALTRQPARFSFDVPSEGPVAFWVQVQQRPERIERSGNPAEAAQVVIDLAPQDDGAGQLRCGTTDVVAFGVLSRSGEIESWRGKLADCSARLSAGTHVLEAHWVRSPGAPADTQVREVVLIPSRED